MKYSAASLALLGCLTLVNCGCTVFGNKPKNSADKSWSISKLWKKEYQKPNSVSVIWSPDVLTLTGKPPTRGFGGRVFFYNERTQAVPVEGELIVHGYLGTPMLGESEQVHANKTFRFTAEQLTGHFSPSELGASYSVWIPWDAADGLREEVTLIPTFKGLDGLIVQGAPAKLYLPGRSLDSASTKGSGNKPLGNSFEAQTVSYQQRTIPTNSTGSIPHLDRQSQPTTIDLPALGSLGRPRGYATPLPGFTLGGPSNPTAISLPSVPMPPRSNDSPLPMSNVPATSSGSGMPRANVSSATMPYPTVSSATVPGANLPTTVVDTAPVLPTSAAVQTASVQQPIQNANAPFENFRSGSLPNLPKFSEQSRQPFALQPWHAQQQ